MYHSINTFPLRAFLLCFLLPASLLASPAPSSLEADNAPKTGGFILPENAPYGAYIAPIPGHPSNPEIPSDMTVTAELISEFNLTLPSPEGPLPFFDIEQLGFPKPYKHDCKTRQQFSAAGYHELIKKGHIVRSYWNGKIEVRHGKVGFLWYDDLVIWFCNSKRSGYQKPNWKRYYMVDGYVEGVCGSRIEGGVGVKAWGGSYGRRKWRAKIDESWYCKDFSYARS